MTKRSALKIGDRILLTQIPAFDLASKSDEPDSLNTVEIIRILIDQQSVVIIDHIDEYGNPWFSADIEISGEVQHHTLAIMDDDYWVAIDAKRAFDDPELQRISDQIDATLNAHASSYDALAEESERLFDAKQRLEQKYAELDNISGLSKLFEAFQQAFHGVNHKQ